MTLPALPNTLPKRTSTNCVPLALQAAADDLGQALRRAHDVRRVDRLVRRHEDEFLDLGRDRGRRHHPGAVGVVEHRLPRVGLLHQRHVLVRAGMEDDARPLAGEHLLDQRRVLDVAHDRRQRQLRETVGERGLDRVDRRLRQVEQHELRGTEAGDVPAELGADRAARAGDHHHAIAEPFAQARVVEDDRIAAQQVVELDRANRGQRRAAADQVLVRRHGQHLDARVGADLRDAAAHAVRGRRQRDDHLAHAVLLRPRRQARDRAQHAHAVQQACRASPGSSSTSPTTRHCRLRANSRVRRAPASPAPITSTGSPSAASGL